MRNKRKPIVGLICIRMLMVVVCGKRNKIYHVCTKIKIQSLFFTYVYRKVYRRKSFTLLRANNKIYLKASHKTIFLCNMFRFMQHECSLLFITNFCVHVCMFTLTQYIICRYADINISVIYIYVWVVGSFIYDVYNHSVGPMYKIRVK